MFRKKKPLVRRKLDVGLLAFATPRQARVLKAVNRNYGNQKVAGESIGLSPSSVRDAIKRLKERARAEGYEPKEEVFT